MSIQIYLNWSNDAPSERLPSSNHHVDDPLPTHHSFYDLLFVLIGQVNIINFQQPVIHPAEKRQSDYLGY